MQINALSPAKINLFLNINKRLNNNYHHIQTLFQFIDLSDKLSFELNKENTINLKFSTDKITINNIDNLIIKAAKLIKVYSKYKFGVNISCEKFIPIGGGLGGGSSNAATTLVVLNKLWNLNLSSQELISLAKKLGADVPIFVKGKSSFAEGTGNKLIEANNIPEKYYLLIIPPISIETKVIFNEPLLIRNTKILKLPTKNTPNYNNDCEKIVRKKYPIIDSIMTQLSELAPRLTGTGACVYIQTGSKEEAIKLQKKYRKLSSKVVYSLNQSPLFNSLKIIK